MIPAFRRCFMSTCPMSSSLQDAGTIVVTWTLAMENLMHYVKWVFPHPACVSVPSLASFSRHFPMRLSPLGVWAENGGWWRSVLLLVTSGSTPLVCASCPPGEDHMAPLPPCCSTPEGFCHVLAAFRNSNQRAKLWNNSNLILQRQLAVWEICPQVIYPIRV